MKFMDASEVLKIENMPPSPKNKSSLEDFWSVESVLTKNISADTTVYCITGAPGSHFHDIMADTSVYPMKASLSGPGIEKSLLQIHLIQR